MTWPQVLMMLCQCMAGFTDIWVGGHIGPEVQASLSLVVQCFFFMMVVGMTMANASVASISQALGAGKPWRAKRYLGMLISLGAVFCLFILLLGYVFRQQFLNILLVPAEIHELSSRLWVIFLASMPSQYAVAFSSAAFRAHKRVLIPLCASVIIFMANLILDFGLGLGYFGLPNLEAEGLALATFISITFGAIFNFYMLHRLGYLRRKSFAPIRWYKNAIGYFIKVAIPAGGMQLSWQLGYLVLMAITASLPRDSVNSVAGLGTGMRIESILFLPAVAFSMTGSVLVGHCLGAGNKKEAKRVGLKVLLVACGSMSLVAACMWPWVEKIAAFMSPKSAEVQLLAITYIRYNIFSTPFTIGSMVLGGILTGAGATIYPFIVYSGAIWIIRLPMAWYLGHISWGHASGIFCAMLVSQIIQCSIIFYVFMKRNWSRFSMNSAKQRRPVKA